MTSTTAGNFDSSELTGGRLALDFVNTISWRGGPTPVERLESCLDWVQWSETAGALSRDEASRLVRFSRRKPDRAAGALARAKDFREALHRLFITRSRGETPSARDLRKLNLVLHRAPERRSLAIEGKSIVWKRERARELEAMLWPIAWSAADLLASSARERIKVCAGDGCGWLFLDQSRNRSRRWCSMSDCGNRAKARRHYARTRTPRAAKKT